MAKAEKRRYKRNVKGSVGSAEVCLSLRSLGSCFPVVSSPIYSVLVELDSVKDGLLALAFSSTRFRVNMSMEVAICLVPRCGLVKAVYALMEPLNEFYAAQHDLSHYLAPSSEEVCILFSLRSFRIDPDAMPRVGDLPRDTLFEVVSHRTA